MPSVWSKKIKRGWMGKHNIDFHTDVDNTDKGINKVLKWDGEKIVYSDGGGTVDVLENIETLTYGQDFSSIQEGLDKAKIRFQKNGIYTKLVFPAGIYDLSDTIYAWHLHYTELQGETKDVYITSVEYLSTLLDGTNYKEMLYRANTSTDLSDITPGMYLHFITAGDLSNGNNLKGVWEITEVGSGYFKFKLRQFHPEYEDFQPIGNVNANERIIKTIFKINVTGKNIFEIRKSRLKISNIAFVKTIVNYDSLDSSYHGLVIREKSLVELQNVGVSGFKFGVYGFRNSTIYGDDLAFSYCYIGIYLDYQSVAHFGEIRGTADKWGIGIMAKSFLKIYTALIIHHSFVGVEMYFGSFKDIGTAYRGSIRNCYYGIYANYGFLEVKYINIYKNQGYGIYAEQGLYGNLNNVDITFGGVSHYNGAKIHQKSYIDTYNGNVTIEDPSPSINNYGNWDSYIRG